jgi:hypothetical protein
MTNVRVAVVASLAVALCGQPIGAQAPFQYREYAPGSTVASVVKISSTREDRTRTLHERPAHIQELEWRAPYVISGSELPDPVRDVLFSFYDDQLYQIVVTYDRDRMEGLTNGDVIESISTTYGVPLLGHKRVDLGAVAAVLPADSTVVAQWEDAASLLTLTRGTYSPQVRLVLISKSLHARAGAAITEALRLDAEEAPQRDRDQRTKAVADEGAASQKARVMNKAAFKP